jgi:hypothetical protein
MNISIINYFINYYINYYKPLIFIGSNNFHNSYKEIENIKINNNYTIVESNVLNLLGSRGLIKDYNIQENLLILYPTKYIFFISNIILNFIIPVKTQWLLNNSYHYNQQINNNYLKHQDYKNPIKNINNNHQWLKKSTNFILQVGNQLKTGIIGKYRYIYQPFIKNNYIIKINNSITLHRL